MRIEILLIFVLFMQCCSSALPEKEIIRAEIYFNPIGVSPLFTLTTEEVINESEKCEIIASEILSKLELKTLSMMQSDKGEISNRIDFVCRIVYKEQTPDFIIGTPFHLEYNGHLDTIDDEFVKMLYAACEREPRKL